MHSSKENTVDTAPGARAALTLAGLFVISLLSSLGMATGNRAQPAPAVDGSHHGRWMQALESRLLVALEKQKPVELGGNGHSPALAAATHVRPAPISFVRTRHGQTSPAPSPRWLLTSAPPRAPPARA